MSGSKVNVWLDCDPGCDDAFALILAAFAPSINLIGVSTVSGNERVDKMTSNALKLMQVSGLIESPTARIDSEQKELSLSDCLSHGGLKLPLVQGCSGPLVGSAVTAAHVHGESGLPAELPSVPQHALDYISALNQQSTHFTTLIYRHLISQAAPTTIVAVGPLTNVALLLVNHPAIKKYIEKIVFMGGSVVGGNRTQFAEFNIYADPIAASIICDSGVPVIMVPLDTTRYAKTTQFVIDEIDSLSSRFSQIFVDLLNHLRKSLKTDSPLMHDPVAVFFLISPSSFEHKLMRVQVETNRSAPNYGQTICDENVSQSDTKCVHVCLRVQEEDFWKHMFAAIREGNQKSVESNPW